MATALTELAAVIRGGLPAGTPELRHKAEAAIEERYGKIAAKRAQVRDAYALGREDAEGGVPWAGLINPENPTSGPYGGASLVWFPGPSGSLIGLGVGTRGISPDEALLTRPGHRRRTQALRRYLARRGVQAWSKSDPAALGSWVPDVVGARWPEFEPVMKRYGNVMYCMAQVPADPELATQVTQSFFDLYAFERGWQPLSLHASEVTAFLSGLRADLFISPTSQSVNDLLRQRWYAILQGPPGTGKTRLALEVATKHFGGRATVIQFHPSVTYEDFVVGLAPATNEGALKFQVRQGAFLDAALSAKSAPHLLVIDEVNRADLGKVLGEAIYLFEPGERRSLRLPHEVDGRREFAMPDQLFVLGTMNTADKSIAGVDIAIRRRFAFVQVPPERQVVANTGLKIAIDAFDALCDVFVEHAPDDALDLLPGHAYYLAPDEATLRTRLRFELLPLLDEYVRQGYLGPATPELKAVRDSIEDLIA